jgi:signal peptide peptidase SppA
MKNDQDLFWAMYAPAFQIFRERYIEAMRGPHNAKPEPEPEMPDPSVSAGPATDAARRGFPIKIIGSTALIPINGVIQKNPSFFMSLFGGSSSRMSELAIQAAARDDEIESILLAIDSPGGAMAGLAELGEAINKAKAQKTVIAQVTGTCASAAYYIASQAHSVFSGRNDLVGSIGVIVSLYDYSGAAEKAGIIPVPITSGAHKADGMPGLPVTDDMKAEFQKIVDFYFEDFCSMVAEGRSMSRETLKPIADGRLFPAPEAMELGLIDGIQSIEQTLSDLNTPKFKATPRRTAAKLKLMNNMTKS